MPDLSPVEDKTVAGTDEPNPHILSSDKNMLEKCKPPVRERSDTLFFFFYLLSTKVVFCADCELLKTDNPLLYLKIRLILKA